MTTEIIYEYYDGTKSTKEIKGKRLSSKSYFKDGKLHRSDGPAREYRYGGKEYRLEGKLHRLDGPAQEWERGHKSYWVNGICVTHKVKYIKEEYISKYLRMLSL